MNPESIKERKKESLKLNSDWSRIYHSEWMLFFGILGIRCKANQSFGILSGYRVIKSS